MGDISIFLKVLLAFLGLFILPGLVCFVPTWGFFFATLILCLELASVTFHSIELALIFSSSFMALLIKLPLAYGDQFQFGKNKNREINNEIYKKRKNVCYLWILFCIIFISITIVVAILGIQEIEIEIPISGAISIGIFTWIFIFLLL